MRGVRVGNPNGYRVLPGDCHAGRRGCRIARQASRHCRPHLASGGGVAVRDRIQDGLGHRDVDADDLRLMPLSLGWRGLGGCRAVGLWGAGAVLDHRCFLPKVPDFQRDQGDRAQKPIICLLSELIEFCVAGQSQQSLPNMHGDWYVLKNRRRAHPVGRVGGGDG